MTRENGNIVERFKDGKVEWFVPMIKVNGKSIKHGLALNYYPSGQIKIEREYVDGEVQGIERFYHPDGTIMHEIAFVNGLKDGAAVYYDKAGAVKRVVYYAKGDRIGDGV